MTASVMGVMALNFRHATMSGANLEMHSFTDIILTYSIIAIIFYEMKWTVETLNDVVDTELACLDPAFKAKFLHIAELLEALGPHKVREPYVKHLEGSLWEMRMKAPAGIARAIYMTTKGRRIVVLHAFVKKTRKTPRKTLDLARIRMKEVE